jgi:hypothetical protein
MVMGLLVILSLGVAAGTLTGHQATSAQGRRSLVDEHAQDFLERCFAIPFGSTANGPANGAQLSELFDEDALLGTATLHGLRAFGSIDRVHSGRRARRADGRSLAGAGDRRPEPRWGHG